MVQPRMMPRHAERYLYEKRNAGLPGRRCAREPAFEVSVADDLGIGSTSLRIGDGSYWLRRDVGYSAVR